MSQLKEILEKEKDRSSLEQCAAINLFREGTFYRAYEWSAWLCLRYFTELKVTHRILKGGEGSLGKERPSTPHRHHVSYPCLSYRAAFTH